MSRTSTLVLAGLCAFAGMAAEAQSRFPTLEEQKASSPNAIQPDSALDRLIDANQDFSLLDPSEAKDLRIPPPWLRVWWRKAHPEGVYDMTDPTGGYPLVLKEIWEWMLHHQDLEPGEPEPDKAPGEESRGFAELVTLSGELRISGAQTTPRSESDIRVNYWDPQKIVSASNSIVGGGMQSQFFSLDGGLTWGQTTLPLTAPDASHSDPTVDWTSDGRAWSTTLGISGGTLRLRSYVSNDNGATWAAEGDHTPSDAQTTVDKQMVWVDHSATSPFANQMYAIWHNGLPAFVSRRTAGVAGTWSAPLQVSGAESTGTAIGNDIKTNAFGDVFAFWPTTTNRRVFVRKSTDGGITYPNPPVQIALLFDGFDIGVPSFNNRRALIYVAAGAYRTATKDMVYATWTDLTGAVGCTAAANEPGANAASTCKTRIWFSRSTNGGTTWSAPVMVNNQAGLNDQYNQWLAVDETTGALGLIYNDTVVDAARQASHMFYQSSFDDGVTWTAPVQVTTVSTNETTAGTNTGNQYGDYNGLSGFAANFFPSWTDRRGGGSGNREEIWTARINDPACLFPGAPSVGTATATAPNQMTVTWSDGAPSSSLFNVARAFGTCAVPGAFTEIATGLAGSPYVDNAVSGGSTYAYQITGTDATSVCESPFSGCVEATATGACTLAPSFTGLSSATNLAQAGCAIRLSWSAATAGCSGTPTYNVYRSTSPGFTPTIGNRIATGVTGTTYDDISPLNNATTYYYEVHAVDVVSSAEESNTLEQSAAPTGTISVGPFTETFEAGVGFDNAGWTHAPVVGAVDWLWSTAQSQTPTHSWFSDSQTTVSNRVLVSPSFVIQPTTTLSFWHTFAFEGTIAQCFDAGSLETSSSGGPWTVVPDAAFTAGGFNGTVNAGFANSLAGKRAWCSGTIGALTQVSVNLAAFNGQSLNIRWNEGDDSSAQATGWFVDSVAFANVGTATACVPQPVELLEAGVE